MASDVLETLQERGFVQQCTDLDAVRRLLSAPPTTLYIGYDPTADSLHVGNLFTLMAVVHLLRAGHRCIVLMGGGTAMVGDPSGKTDMRQMLSAEQIAANVERVRRQVSTILTPQGGECLVVDNAQWLMKLSYIEFLRDIGRHFSVNRMLAAEAYKQRLERGLSFIEFNYQLLQAYDFVELRRRHDCRLQMGGDDQWGNILAGVDLCRRLDGELVHGLTLPLVLNAAGEKMGKTAAGAVWLSAERLSPYDYYQYWVNIHDEDVARMLAFFTFLPMAEIRRVGGLGGAELNQAKSVLAYETTAFLHGEAAAGEAHHAAMAGFGGRSLSTELLPSSRVPRRPAADVTSLPTTTLGATDLGAGVTLIELMTRVGLAKSKGEARRLIDQGAVRIDDARIDAQMHQIDAASFGAAAAITVRVGKKKIHRFCLADGNG